MSVFYLRSADGSDADNGSTWALAKATLRTATTGALAVATGAGDTIYVADGHSETDSAAEINLVALGTASGPTRIIAVDDTGDPAPPTSLIASGNYAVIATSGTRALTLAGNGYYYGIDFQCALTSSSATYLTLGRSSEVFSLTLDSCKLTMASSHTGCRTYLGNGASTGSDNSACWLRDTVFEFASTSQRIGLNAGSVTMIGCSIDATGSIPSVLLEPQAAITHNVTIRNCDLSAITGALVYVANACTGTITFSQCKLGAGVAVINGTIPGPGGLKVVLHNCDSGDTNYRMEQYTYQGSIKTETSKVRSGGASDGTTTISWNMTTLTSGPSFTAPLESPPLSIWNDTTGTAKTVTVEIAQDNAAAALNDDDIWLEVEYLGTSGYPLAVIASDRKSTILATAAAQTASSVTWNTMTTPTRQKLEVSFTPREKGYLQARVMLAKPSVTVYVDPLLVVT